MSFFTNLRADRLITEIRSCTDPASPATQKAVERLKDLGPAAIESVFAALPDADKNATLAFVEVLSGLVSQKSFPLFVRGLVEGSPRVVAGIAWALTSSRNYPANLLIEALATPGVSKSALLEVMAAQKSRFGVRELLTAAYTQEPNEKAALFRIIGDIADANAVPELIGRVHGKDPIARVHIINILARFNTPEVQTALQGLLKDPNKLIRGATLSALQRMDGKIDIERVCALLQGSRDRRAEQGHRCRHQGERSRHHPLPDRDPEGRERERAPRRGRGTERGRQREVGEVPARGAEGQRLVGAQPRGRCARQDRRPAR